ncbi:MAG: polymerase III subunit delta protein [candidate division TM6 bacterium GW2011_GWE2_36_25]|nr:MAG: polymerase III subunit delta protein [candidate division TM6 bacterium GW2011_GWF2_36_131]KKQ03468.1 MAG: polymerase III subunit delta protein [candidate division TM6 bacterium GW2011_GWE2_36_25]KKQ20258.1 MAG: polymerase III subunit delta protein [candidate division TM6 bacterium GW2011_GWA2_36_9]
MNNPAQLWIGNQQLLKQEVILFLQKQFCPRSCHTCITCNKIQELQHHNLMWISPDKQYTLNLLEPLFEKLSFANAMQESFFFILERADLLTTACANSLLKSVEEPPTGYNFIFLAQRTDAILPTIKSRCITKVFHEEKLETTHEPFLQHFKVKTEPLSFLQALETAQPNEQESIELIDSLLHYWSTQYLKNQQKKIEQIIAKLQQAIKKPPMPGGSKIFWKNVYLSLNSHLGKQN